MSCHKVKIGRKTFKAGCGRKKRDDGVRRQKPHWGAKASGKAKSRAMRNSAFKANMKALPKAQKTCARKHKPFTKSFGACIRKELA